MYQVLGMVDPKRRGMSPHIFFSNYAIVAKLTAFNLYTIWVICSDFGSCESPIRKMRALIKKIPFC